MKKVNNNQSNGYGSVATTAAGAAAAGGGGGGGRISVADSNQAVAFKQLLERSNFDPSVFLTPFIMQANSDDPEVILLSIFDDLTQKFTILSKDIEDDLCLMNGTVETCDGMMKDDLDQHDSKLHIIKDDIDKLKTNFDNASAGAISIGERLCHAEKSRSNVANAISILDYIKSFEAIPTSTFNDIHMLNITQLKGTLPQQMQGRSWGDISMILFELRRVLMDITSDDVQNAVQNISKLTEAIETELLGEFENSMVQLMQIPNDASLLAKAKELAKWLQLYNNGQSLHRRYVYSVIEHSIPKTYGSNFNSKQQNSPTKSTLIGKLSSVAKPKIYKSNNGNVKDNSKTSANSKPGAVRRVASLESLKVDNHDDDDNSSGGASDDESDFDRQTSAPAGNLVNRLVSNVPTGAKGKSPQSSSSLDKLSELFSNISRLCHEQFYVIRQIFAPSAVAKIIRLLVTRIFRDPGFGINVQVDALLVPKPPSKALTLSDYLDLLTAVREKLSALHILLLEYCITPTMTVSPSGRNLAELMQVSEVTATTAATTTAATTTANTAITAVEINDRIKSDAEVREFLLDQVSQVLNTYVLDYFDKEMMHVHTQYNEYLLRSLGNDQTMVIAPTVMSPLPKLKAERFKSVKELTDKVGSMRLMNSVFIVTTESVSRMESIGKDDKRLPNKVKDLYLLEMEFLIESLFLPCMSMCTTTLLKTSSVRAQSSALPPTEFLISLSTVYGTVEKLKTHFDDVFLRPLATQPNLIELCKETRKTCFKRLEKCTNEALQAWVMSVGFHIDKMLSLKQTKYDYCPQVSMMGNSANKSKQAILPTNACITICREILVLADGIKSFQSDLSNLNIVDVFWKPLGIQFVGILLTHLKLQKISPEGAKYLIKDVEQYRNILSITQTAGIIDMLVCLKDICGVYTVAPEKVIKKVTEDLRYLDTHIVLSLIKSRVDAISKSPDHWYSILTTRYYGNVKVDAPLAWEGRKNISVMAFNNLVQGQNNNGPSTLRKAPVPLSEILIIEAANGLKDAIKKNLYYNTSSSSYSIGSSNSNPGASIDIIATSIIDKISDGGGGLANIQNQFSKISSQFAPSRPTNTNKMQQPKKAPELSVPALNFMSRPDLIGHKKAQTSVDGNGVVNGVGNLVENKAKAAVDAMKGAAHGLGNLFKGSSIDDTAAVSSNSKQSSIASKFSMTNPFGEPKKAPTGGAKKESVLNKMTNLFG